MMERRKWDREEVSEPVFTFYPFSGWKLELEVYSLSIHIEMGNSKNTEDSGLLPWVCLWEVESSMNSFSLTACSAWCRKDDVTLVEEGGSIRVQGKAPGSSRTTCVVWGIQKFPYASLEERVAQWKSMDLPRPVVSTEVAVYRAKEPVWHL